MGNRSDALVLTVYIKWVLIGFEAYMLCGMNNIISLMLNLNKVNCLGAYFVMGKLV